MENRLEDRRARKAPRRGLSWLAGAFLACVLVVGAGGAALARQSSDNAQTANAASSESKDFAAIALEECAKGGTYAKQLRAAGLCSKAQQIVDRPGPPGSKGDTGTTGAIGPTGPQGPQGPQGVAGPIGKTGPPPGCALLSSACQGSTGATGPQGPQGAQGAAGDPGADGATGGPGPEGPPGKDGVAGADGKAGTDGAAGAPGRGIADTDCLDDGTWRIAYTDGTEQIVNGPCKVIP